MKFQELLVCLFFLSFLSMVSSVTTITNCTDITVADSYLLLNDVDGAAGRTDGTQNNCLADISCMKVSVSNVDLNFGGFTVANCSGFSRGIVEVIAPGLDPLTNVTVRNGAINNSMWSELKVINVKDSFFTNLSLSNNTGGLSGSHIFLSGGNTNNSFTNLYLFNSPGFCIYDSGSASYNTFTNVTFHNCTGGGFYSSDSPYMTFTNVTMTNSSLGYCIQLQSIHNLSITNMTLEHCSLDNSYGGMFLSSIYDSNFTNLTIDHSYYGALLSGGFRNLNFSGLTIRNCTRYGAYIDMSMMGFLFQNNIIGINEISNNTFEGIYYRVTGSGGFSKDYYNNTFFGGSIHSNGGNGFRIDDNGDGTSLASENWTIRDILIYNNTGSNLNITNTANFVFSNLSLYYTTTPPLNWSAIELNNARNATFSHMNFSTNGSAIIWRDGATDMNASLSHALFNSGTNSADISLNATPFSNFTLFTQTSAPDVAPYGVDLGYYLNITNSSAAKINLTFYYTDSDLLGLDETLMKMYSYSNGVWTDLSTLTEATVTQDVSAKSISVINISSFSIFGIFAPLSVASSVTTVSSSDSSKSMLLSHKFDCTTGKLTVGTGGVERVALSLIQTEPNYFLVRTASTTSNGAEFIISKSGTYKLRASRVGYNSEQMSNIKLTLCSESPDQVNSECTVDSDCLSSEECVEGNCASITGACGYASDHEWIAYQCCADTDCSIGQACTFHECVSVVSELEQKAREALENARAKLDLAKAEGKDISGAEIKYNEAELMFQNKDYESSISVSTISVSLIRETPKSNSLPSNPTSINQQQNPTNQEPPKKQDALPGILLMLGAGAVLLVVLVGAYFIINGRKK